MQQEPNNSCRQSANNDTNKPSCPWASETLLSAPNNPALTDGYNQDAKKAGELLLASIVSSRCSLSIKLSSRAERLMEKTVALENALSWHSWLTLAVLAASHYLSLVGTTRARHARLRLPKDSILPCLVTRNAPDRCCSSLVAVVLVARVGACEG